MSSTSLMALRQSNYVSLALISSVGYDYILIFPKEMEYVWGKPWSWVSTLYILVRYCGLYNLVFGALVGSSFIPDSAKVPVSLLPKLYNSFHSTVLQAALLTDIGNGTYILFLGSADFVMILRVWAMYSRSRVVLSILLTGLFIEIISLVTYSIIDSNLNNDSWQDALLITTEVTDISQITFAAMLCMLAIIQFARQSLQMYHVTKQWQLNRYINLLVQQGILHFFVIGLLNLIDELNKNGKIPGGGWKYILASIPQYVPVFTLTPRFIIIIREIYADDVQGRRWGGIDSGFGLSTPSGTTGEPIMPTDEVESEIADNVDAGDGQNEGTGDIEEAPRGPEGGSL